MKKYGVVVLTMALAAQACGPSADVGAPDSWGSGSTNTLVSALLSPAAITIDICNDNPVAMTVSFLTNTIDPSLPANTLYLTGYSLDFIPVSAGAPQLAGGGSYALTQTLPVSNVDVVYIAAPAKRAFREAACDQRTGLLYTARYTFYGVDRYGSSFGVVARQGFSMARYGGCIVSVAPLNATVKGVDEGLGPSVTSDDIAYSISGGFGPFLVSADQPGLTNAPMQLGAGETTFVVDANAVSAATNVQLTVTDIYGDRAVANVTITP